MTKRSVNFAGRAGAHLTQDAVERTRLRLQERGARPLGLALVALREWAERDPERYFEVRFLNAPDSKYQWVARVENTTTQWAYQSDEQADLRDAALQCLNAAAEQGMQ